MHEGHRKRLLEKLKNGDSLFEHELLEILLFNAYPRKNVNPVAHALLKRFPCINEILNAEVEELTAVEGVGENVALYLKCIGECLRYKSDSEASGVPQWHKDAYQTVRPPSWLSRRRSLPHGCVRKYSHRY